MKIKQKNLRKGLAQLPINYPAPSVADVFDFEKEKHRVEDICKKLAHVEVEVRDAALAEMPRYLQEVCTSYVTSNGAVADADVEMLLQKLSMGLFYCYWHSDKPLVQHECAFRIAQLMNTVPNPTMQRMVVEAMFRILSREWGRIDRYRLDKYMSLVRKLIFQMLALIKRHYTEALKRLESGAAASEEKAAPVAAAASPGKKKGGKKAAAAAEETDNAAEAEKKSEEEEHAEAPLTDAQRRDANEQAALTIPFIANLKDFFQKFLLVEPRSVGLTMHLMDVMLDEFIRSDIDVALFNHMSQMIPLFAMSRGDFIEKRVLDNFIGPIVSGVLDERRVATIATSPETIKQASLKRKSAKTVAAEEAEAALRNHSEENDWICLRLSAACKDLSVGKETRHYVRPLLSEAQMLLEQRLAVKLNPKQFRRLTYRDMRRRVTKELQEAEESVDKTMKFRKLVKDERREVKKKARKLLSREQEGVGKKKTKTSSSSKTGGAADKKGGKGGKKKIVISDADAMGHEVAVPKKKAPLNPAVAAKLARKLSSSKSVSGRVKEELGKIARSEQKKQMKAARLGGGETETKLSTKGFSQNSKRHKYGKLTGADIKEMESMDTPVWKKKR